MHPTRIIVAAASILCTGIFAPLASIGATANPVGTPITAIVAFGDSLSDAGNVFLATRGKQPGAPYYQGQYSNGPNWVQVLSAELQLARPKPSVAGGSDYAFGGATTSHPATTFTQVPNLTQQIDAFSASLAHAPASASALYTVWVGANDIFSILESEPGSACAKDPVTCTKGAAQAEVHDIERLAALGARNFLVPLVPDLGSTPLLRVRSAPERAAGRDLSTLYNDTLRAGLARLKDTPGVTLHIMDAFKLLDDAIDQPATLGLSNAKTPCYKGTENGGGRACAAPGNYLFWDQIHPTAAGQKAIAREALGHLR
jgi:phospholipase/lecithinase/hemolysin